jgi:rod shape-determining protein MreD
MNAAVIYTSREEIEVHKFTPWAAIGIPFFALLLQAFLPTLWHGRLSFLNVFDLPLLVTIFFAVARRNPVTGTLTGAAIGLAQDALTANYIGLFGMAKSVVGYVASSIAAKIDVENPGSRVILTVGFYLLQRAVYLIVQSGLVREEIHFDWLHSLIAAFANGVLAIVVFSILDRFKRRT